MDYLDFLKGFFLTQGLNPSLFTSPALAGRFFTTSATWEALLLLGHTSSSLKGSLLSSHYLSIFCPQSPPHYLFLKSQLKYFVFNCVSPNSFKQMNCISYCTLHTVHRVLKAEILKWFAIPFSSGPRFVRTLHHDPSILGGPTGHGS